MLRAFKCANACFNVATLVEGEGGILKHEFKGAAKDRQNLIGLSLRFMLSSYTISRGKSGTQASLEPVRQND